MIAYPLSILGLLLSGALLVQLVPEQTGNMNTWALRLALTVATWIVTLTSVLVLAERGAFSFAGESKLGIVALHCFWGLACFVIALEISPSALPFRMAIGLVPLLINLALLLPGVPAQAVIVAALACQGLGTGGFFLYATIVDTKREMAEDKTRAERHATEAKVQEDALLKEIEGFTAETPMETLFALTRHADGPSRDRVVTAAIAKKPNLEAELIAALHGDASARWGARTFLASPLTPRTDGLAAALSDSILLEAAGIVATSTDDAKDAAAYGAVTAAESLPDRKAALRPAMLRLQEVTGTPVKQPGRVTGREELARWLR